jgi:hypothetical protein
MTELTPARIADQIERVIERLEDLTHSLADLSYKAAIAEASFKSAYAQARLRHRAATKEKLTEAMLTDLADDECEELRAQHLIASAQHSAARDALRATQSQLDGLRTLSSSVRAVS